MVMRIRSPGIVSLFKHFHRYLDIVRDIDAYSATLTGAQLGRGGGEGRPPLSFLKCPDFGKKGTGCVRIWVKLSYYCAFDEMFIEVP